MLQNCSEPNKVNYTWVGNFCDGAAKIPGKVVPDAEWMPELLCAAATI